MIVMLVLGVFMAASLDGIRTVRESAQVEEALVLARSHLALSEVQPVVGDTRGEDRNGFQWHVNTRVLDYFDDKAGQAVTTLYGVTVWISWISGGRVHEVSLYAEHLYTPPPPETSGPRPP